MWMTLPAVDVVEIWVWSIGACGNSAYDLALLSPDERVRAARFHHARDRDRFVAARAGMRRRLARYQGMAPHSLAFRTSPTGKPRLDPPAVAFNLSHAADLAALAVARFPVGIDIEQVRDGFSALAATALSADEVCALDAMVEAERSVAFFRCWTRKEAYVKALGHGLKLPLDRFAVTMDATVPARLLRVDGDPAERGFWQMAHLDPAPGFVGAVAARHLGWRLVHRSLD